MLLPVEVAEFGLLSAPSNPASSNTLVPRSWRGMTSEDDLILGRLRTLAPCNLDLIQSAVIPHIQVSLCMPLLNPPSIPMQQVMGRNYIHSLLEERRVQKWQMDCSQLSEKLPVLTTSLLL